MERLIDLKQIFCSEVIQNLSFISKCFQFSYIFPLEVFSLSDHLPAKSWKTILSLGKLQIINKISNTSKI